MSDEERGVMLSRVALEALQALPEAQARSVARAIRCVGLVEGARVELNDRAYQVLVPMDAAAPVVCFRRLLPDEDGEWRVVALVSRADWVAFRRAKGSRPWVVAAGRAGVVVAGASV